MLQSAKGLKALSMIVCLLILGIIAASALTVPPSPKSLIEPMKGPLYTGIDLEDDQNLYNYSIELGVLAALQKERPFIIKLMISDPLNNKWIEVARGRYYPKSEKWFNITADLSTLAREASGGKKILEKLEYKLVSTSDNRTIFAGFGPEIVVNFRNESWQRSENGSYNYSVSLCSSISNLAIDILYKNSDRVAWRSYNRSKTYNSSKNWKLIVWTGAPYLYKIKFNPFINSSAVTPSSSSSPPALSPPLCRTLPASPPPH
jgi:hypothetical protein